MSQWFLSVVGKKQLTNVEEYKKAVEEIEKYGEKSVTILTDFIESAGKSKDKETIIEEWEELILNFYRRPNNKNIFEGQLILAYQARLGKVQYSSKVNVASWVEKMLFYKEQSQISTLEEIMRKGSFTSSDLKKISDRIDENERTVDEKKSEVASFKKKSVDTLKMYDYLDFYINILPDKIKEKLSLGKVQSLLPQDIVQQIIEEDFDGVPI